MVNRSLVAATILKLRYISPAHTGAIAVSHTSHQLALCVTAPVFHQRYSDIHNNTGVHITLLLFFFWWSWIWSFPPSSQNHNIYNINTGIKSLIPTTQQVTNYTKKSSPNLTHVSTSQYESLMNLNLITQNNRKLWLQNSLTITEVSHKWWRNDCSKMWLRMIKSLYIVITLLVTGGYLSSLLASKSAHGRLA